MGSFNKSCFILFILSINLIFARRNTSSEKIFSFDQRKGLSTVFQWKTLDWEFPSEAERQKAIANGDYRPGLLLPLDVDVYYSDKDHNNLIFISVPRFQLGVPATLNTVNPNGMLSPYPPDWSWHQSPQLCRFNRIVSVYRMMIDECSRLWVLDTGIIDTEQACPPQILSFDLKTDQLISKYEIPQGQYKPYSSQGGSILVTAAIDVRNPQQGCQDTFVYMADITAFAIIVYDTKTQRSWRIEHNLFYPYPPYGHFTILGESFDLMDGILAMSLSPNVPGQDRTLFFHSLASVTENRVSTRVLQNQTLFASSPHGDSSTFEKFYLYPGTRSSQAVASVIDSNGIQYFVLTTDVALACWNTRTEYGGKNIDILERNSEKLQFASGIKVVKNRKGNEELWTITNRFQKLMAGTLNANEVNFRILAAKINDLTRGSRCKNNIGGFRMSGSYSRGYY